MMRLLSIFLVAVAAIYPQTTVIGSGGGGAETNDLEATITGIASGEMLVGDGVDSAVYVTPSGDATITTGGVVAVVDDSHNHTETTISGLDVSLTIAVFGPTTAVSTGNGKAYFPIPSFLNTYELTGVSATTTDAGVTGTMTIQLARCAVAATGDQCASSADMLSTLLQFDTNEANSLDATNQPVINTSNDDVATSQQIRVDIDAIHSGTAANGLVIILTFSAP